jgi:hypothetical protein
MKDIIVNTVSNIPKITATLPRAFISTFRNNLREGWVLLFFIIIIPEMIMEIEKMVNNRTKALNSISFSGEMICKTITTKIADAIVGGRKKEGNLFIFCLIRYVLLPSSNLRFPINDLQSLQWTPKKPTTSPSITSTLS